MSEQYDAGFEKALRIALTKFKAVWDEWEKSHDELAVMEKVEKAIKDIERRLNHG